uniref:Uncharacterized protein n=1 Tax=Cucumis sativus TaxID=3659 RepID=A0A0A0LVY7_CUCSA
MDPIAAAKNKKKRTFSYEATSNVQDDSVAHHPASFTFPTRIDAMCKSIVEDAVTRSRSQMEEPRIGEVVKRFYDEIWPKVENDFRQQVFKEVQRMIHSAIHSAISPSLRALDDLLVLCFINVFLLCSLFANGPVKFNHVMDDSAIKDFGLMSDFIEWPDVTEEFFLPVQAEASNICEVDDETQYQKLQIKVRPKPK